MGGKLKPNFGFTPNNNLPLRAKLFNYYLEIPLKNEIYPIKVIKQRRVV